MSFDDLWRGPYVKIPWTLFDDPEMHDPRKLARYVRHLIEEDKARRSRRRAYVPRDVWQEILSRFGHRCAYCGRSDLPLVREHRMPIALGGPDIPSNLVPACQPCNSRKYKSHPDDWPLVVDPV